MREWNIGSEIPSNLLVALKEDDVHSHVVLAKLHLIEGFAIHMDDECCPPPLGTTDGRVAGQRHLASPGSGGIVAESAPEQEDA